MYNLLSEVSPVQHVWHVLFCSLQHVQTNWRLNLCPEVSRSALLGSCILIESRKRKYSPHLLFLSHLLKFLIFPAKGIRAVLPKTEEYEHFTHHFHCILHEDFHNKFSCLMIKVIIRIFLQFNTCNN